MRPEQLFLFSLLIIFLSLILVCQASAAEFSWRDDFGYTNIQEMQNAGWTLSNPSGTRLGVAGVIVDGTKADTGITYSGHFQGGIENFTVEIRASWLGSGHSQPAIYIGTTRHNYGFVADGWYSRFGFYRDGAKPVGFGSYKEQANTWVTLRLEKQENVLSMSCDGKVVNVFYENDTQPSQLTGVSTVAPWRGDEEYDYYMVSSSVSGSSTVASSGFPVVYVAIGGGIAAVAIVGAVVYFFFISGGSAAAAAGVAGGAVAAGLAGLAGDALEGFVSNLVSDTVVDVVADLGYDVSSLTLRGGEAGQLVSGPASGGNWPPSPPGDKLQSAVTENQQYSSQEKNADLSTSRKSETISKATNQSGQSDQPYYGGPGPDEMELQSVTEVVNDTITETVMGPIEEILLEGY